MTAASVIARSERAFLLTDAGWFHHDGTIMRLAGKVVSSERLLIASAFSGLATNTTDADVAAWLDVSADQAEAIRILPDLVGMLQQINMVSREAGRKAAGDIPPSVQMYVAMWSRERQRGEAYICGSEGSTFGGGYEAGTVRQVLEVFQPPVGRAICPDNGFDPERDGRAIFELQRQEGDERGIRRVAGWGDVTTVGADGITTTRVCTWPDRIGEKVALQI